MVKSNYKEVLQHHVTGVTYLRIVRCLQHFRVDGFSDVRTAENEI